MIWLLDHLELVVVTISISFVSIIIVIVIYDSQYKFICSDSKKADEWFETCVANRSQSFLGSNPYAGCKADKQKLFCEKVKKND